MSRGLSVPKPASQPPSPVSIGVDTNISSGFITVRHCTRCLDLGTEKGRRRQLIKVIVLSLLPGIMLIVQHCISLHNSTTLLQRKAATRDQVLFSVAVGDVVHKTQIERGYTALYISSSGDPATYSVLFEKYLATDEALHTLPGWFSRDDPPHFKSKQIFHDRIKTFRNTLNSNTTTIADTIKFYTDDNALMIDWVIESVKFDGSLRPWAYFVAYHLLLVSKDYIGVQRALGSTFFAQGGFSTSDRLRYNKYEVLGQKYLDESLKYSNRVREVFASHSEYDRITKGLESFRLEIESNTTENSVRRGNEWFNNMTEYIDIFRYAQDIMGGEIVQVTENEMTTIKNSVTINVCLMVFILVLNMLILPVLLSFVFKMTATIHRVANQLKQKTTDLVKEKKRSETLLYLMLPKSVAQQLMNHRSVEPEAFKSVTVLFSDVVGFTSICSHAEPMQVIDMLNIIYATFDDLLEKYDVFKVETIGDAYMVVSGLPNRNGQRHVAEIAFIALDLQRTISSLVVPQVYPETLRLRIGINTGPVVAGVVGHKMLRYCVFGDTVNTASRMESACLPLKIQCSESTFQALEQFPQFQLFERGDIAIKGKGHMRTYWLEGVEAESRCSSTTELSRKKRLYKNDQQLELEDIYTEQMSESFKCS